MVRLVRLFYTTFSHFYHISSTNMPGPLLAPRANNSHSLAKKPTLTIALQENPVIIRNSDIPAVIHGAVTLTCSRDLPVESSVIVELTGVKTLINPQQMGSQESTHEIIRHSKCSLPVIHTYSRSTIHTLPFEFVLDASAPPTLRVPRCSVEYTVSARLVSAGMLHRMYLFGLRRYRASQTLILHSYPSTRNLYDLDMRMRSEIRQGVLGADISHFNPVPFFAVLDRGIAHVGGKVAIHIVIDPPDHDNSSDVSSMSSIVSENSFQSGSSVGILGPEPRNRRSRYLLRKPITGTARPQCLLSTNTVTSAHPPVLKYRVRVTLEQLVRYTTQATSFDKAYSFDITKNVSASTQTTTADLACIDSGSHLTMELSIPSTLQCSIDTCNASVRYEARVVFCPVMFTGMLPIRLAKRTMSWIANKRTEIVFPVCVAPAPLNMLMGCPPPYSQ